MALCAPAPRLAQPLDGAKNAVAETNLGDLVADAMRAAAQADFALVQASALQPVTIPAGDLGDDDIRAMLVFPAADTITALQLDGARIRDALERSLSMLPYPNKGFLQVSGLNVRFDPKAPPGSRVQSVVAATTNAPLDHAKTYRVAVPESLAKGALGYFRVFNSAPRDPSDATLSQALARFAAAAGPISLRVEGRIRPAQ